MKCPKCGYENADSVIVCNSCATLLPTAQKTIAVGTTAEEEREYEAPARAPTELEFHKTSLTEICEDVKAQGIFNQLASEVKALGFNEILDYTIPQFGKGNFTKALYSSDPPAYAGVVLLTVPWGSPQVYPEFTTPFEDGRTLTSTGTFVLAPTSIRPPEHLVIDKPGIPPKELFDLHRQYLSEMISEGAKPAHCTPENYKNHFQRYYEEAFAYVSRGVSLSQLATGRGIGCSSILTIAFTALWIILALLLWFGR